jgi:DNA-binding CsgD family transcriptional regulator
MIEAEVVSSLVGDVYDAALSPALWPSVLEKCAGFVGGGAAALFAKDAASKTGSVAYYSGIEPRYKQLYFEKIIKIDPLTIGHFFAEIEQPISVSDIMDYSEFLETRAYREWGRPQGIIDVLNVALDRTPTSAAMFCVFRHEWDGRVDEEMRRRMRIIAPHIRRAVLIGRVIELRTSEAASFADTLDRIRQGTLLVDAFGRVVHANAAGHTLLAEGSVLSAVGRKLAAHDAEAEQALHDVLLMAGNGDAGVGIKGIAVPLIARDGERFVAHVLPLTSGARRRAGASYAAVAALFVHKAAFDTPSPPEIIAKTYRLTPSELRVLLAVVEVGGVPEVAEALGVAETTVRFHLRQLFEKTGTCRQADLVKLVAGFANPIAG